jgi:hypothetical protein
MATARTSFCATPTSESSPEAQWQSTMATHDGKAQVKAQVKARSETFPNE